jgi:very-long-chain (3R)-3-hydroxyacyl-CoA dehydratase
MVLSWALTEVIRYTFYAASLVGWEFGPLLWARYSTFFVLYPTGAGSEALVNLATLPISVASGGSWLSVLPFAHWDTYALLRGVLFVVWWPGELLSAFIPVPPFFPFMVYPCLCSSRCSRTRGMWFFYAGLYPMYAHMIKQRRRVYGGQKLGAKPKTH